MKSILLISRILLVSLLFFFPKNCWDQIKRLSNSSDMAERTMQVHFCNRSYMHKIRARRNAYIAKIYFPNADSILIIQNEYMFNRDVIFHSYCNDSSGTPRLLDHAHVSMNIPVKLSARKYFEIYNTNMSYNVFDYQFHDELQNLAKVAFSSDGNITELESWFYRPRQTGDISKYYIWLIVREGDVYETRLYCCFVGDLKEVDNQSSSYGL